jgi:hypothetical protein
MALKISIPIHADAKKAKDDIIELTKELKQSEQISRLADKELKTNANSAEALSIKYKSLADQLRIQTDVLNQQHKGLAASNDDMNGKRKTLDEATAAFERSSNILNKNSKEYLSLKAAMEIANSEFLIAKKRVEEWERGLEIADTKTRILRGALKDSTNDLKEKMEAAKALGSELLNQSGNLDLFGTNLRANLAADVILGTFRQMGSNLSNYLSQGAEAAQQFAVSQQQLTTIMQNNMNATDEQIQSIISLAEAQQQLGVVSQSAQVAGAQQLAMNIQQAETLQTLIPLMNDLAVQQYGVNVSQQSMTRIASELNRAMGGNARRIERLGIAFSDAQMEIMKTGTEAERLAVLLEAIPARVDGMNAAFAQTEVGRLAQLNILLENTRQNIGEVYNSLRAEFGTAVLPDAEKMFAELLQFVEKNRDSLSDLMGVLSGIVSFLLNNSRLVVGALGTVGTAIAGMKIQAQLIALDAWITKIGLTKSALLTKTGVIKALTAAMAANPLFIVGTLAGFAVFGLGAIIRNITTEFERQTEHVRELAEEYRRLDNETNEIENNLETINRRIDELRNSGPLNFVEQEELDRLERVVEILERERDARTAEAHLIAFNLETNALEILNGIPERLLGDIRAYEEYARELEEINERINDTRVRILGGEELSSTEDNYFTHLLLRTVDLSNNLDELSRRISRDNSLINENSVHIRGLTGDYDTLTAALYEAKEEYRDYIIARAEATGTFADEMEAAQQEAERLRNLAESTAQLRTASQEAAQSLNNLIASYRAGNTSGREYAAALSEMLGDIEALSAANPELADQFQQIGNTIRRELIGSPEYFQNLRRETTNMVREVDLLRDALRDYSEAGQLSVNTALRLIETGYSSALIFEDETGAIRLCTVALNELSRARLTAQVAEREAARSEINRRLMDEVIAIEEASRANYGLANARLHAAQAIEIARQHAQGYIADLNAEINLLNQMINAVGTTPPPRRSGGGTSTAVRDAERESEEERRARVSAFENMVREREEISRGWIDRERFYRRLSAEDEIAANERVLAYLREYLEDLNDLHEANDEERLRIRRNILSQIDRYERAHWTSQRQLIQEGEQDATRAAQRVNDALQREADNAKNDTERYRAYGRMREALQTQLYATLTEISNRFWLTEREQIHLIEDAHREHMRNIERIEQRMQDIRINHLREQATEWRTFETSQLDSRRAQLDEQHRLQRDAYNRELEALREHFAKLDAEERRWERGRNLSDLLEEENVWANAATQSGRDRLNNIRRQIEDLQRQEEREQRSVFRQQAEDTIRGRITTLDANHRNQVDAIDRERAALQEKYEAMRAAASQLAGETQIGLTDAGLALKNGLENMYAELDRNIDRLILNQISKTQGMAVSIVGVLAQVQSAFGRLNSSIGGTNITDNSRHVSISSTNTFVGNDKQGISQFFDEQMRISSRALTLKV